MTSGRQTALMLFTATALCGLVVVSAEQWLAPATTQPSTPPATVPSTTQPLPSAQDVIDRYIDVTGGKDAYASITSRHVEANYEMADLGVHGTLVIDIRADGNARQHTVIPNLDTFTEGVTGDVIWRTSMTNGPTILSGREADSFKRSLSFSPEISLDAYKAADVIAIAEINGVPCYKMQLQLKAIDAAEMRYYDIKTGYLLRRDSYVLTAEGSVEVITRYGDYEDAPPIRMPMKIRQSMSGLSPEQINTKVQHNIEISDAVFALPADVVELLSHRAATQPAN